METEDKGIATETQGRADGDPEMYNKDLAKRKQVEGALLKYGDEYQDIWQRGKSTEKKTKHKEE